MREAYLCFRWWWCGKSEIADHNPNHVLAPCVGSLAGKIRCKVLLTEVVFSLTLSLDNPGPEGNKLTGRIKHPQKRLKQYFSE